jgi:hypothetical protein
MGSVQPDGPRDVTPMIRPVASSAGPPESPLQMPVSPRHSLPTTRSWVPQPYPTHSTCSPSRRRRTPPSRTPPSVSPKPTAE